MFGAILGGLLHSVVFPLVVTLYADESCDGDGGSLAVPEVNIGEAGTGEGVCNKCTGDVNIFFIARISAGLWIYPMFFKSSGIG